MLKRILYTWKGTGRLFSAAGKSDLDDDRIILIREAVDNLASHTVVGQIHFQTNTTKLVIKAKLFGANQWSKIEKLNCLVFD
jgi:hypothetical protein